MKIDHYISELLFEHDCVIVPQFGGFVGNYSPAKVDTSLHKFSPPSKEISFNKNLSNNDGLLSNHVALREEKPFAEANTIISNYAVELKAALKDSGRAEVEKVGVLFNDEQRNIRFEPDTSINYLIDSFGLNTFHSPAIKSAAVPETERTVTPRLKKVPVDKPPVPSERRNQLRRAIPYAIAAIPVILYMLWVPLYTDVFRKDSSFSYSDLNPFSEKICPVYAERQELNTTLIPEEVNTNISLLNLSDSVSTVSISFFDKSEPEYSEEELIIVRLRDEIKAVAVNTYVDTVEPKANFRFHVIGGCFKFLSNAKRLVKKLRKKGFEAAIIDKHKGLHRVSFNGFTSREEATTALRSIRADQNPEAWLLVK